jgi:hypothetical protein
LKSHMVSVLVQYVVRLGIGDPVPFNFQHLVIARIAFRDRRSRLFSTRSQSRVLADCCSVDRQVNILTVLVNTVTLGVNPDRSTV